eukprot:CAMPEP_0195283896 /NCGR_PEP_ID=MMETSP0707-20130614/2287_1 /TAXON_ID=33640 /ORGANISM="Asterionellopsis glacialis, Strain CCMP134" /LENGTH=282 /DNA_ID=CAMNT_0040343147 /DNA_START=384 /DNA_END=1235 /DNA_ORIENTATION=+
MARRNGREISHDEINDFHRSLGNIPLDRRTGYELATVHCPDLLETETSPRLFLIREDFDPDKAARRLVEYWNMRVEIFGTERAFLPMTFAGALHDDAEVYRLMVLFPDFRTFLPNDDSGRTVVYCKPDYGKDDFTGCSRTAMMKYVWYNLHLALKRESTILRGLVFILNMMNNQQLSLKSFDRLKNKMIVKATVNCFPVHIRAVHYCTRPQALHLRMILPVLKFFMNQELRQRLVVHAQHTNELREELVGYNIRLEVLPTCLGGRFQLNPYWAEEQRELEQR